MSSLPGPPPRRSTGTSTGTGTGVGGAPADVVVKGRYSTYQLQEPLGRGGSAIVYRAVDRATGQEVAVKKLTARDDGAMHQWRTEVETLMALKADDDGAHHVIRYLDHMQAATTIIIVEEYAAGGSLLAQLRAQRQGFDERTAARLAQQVTSGLAYIHGKSIVHRDLKCANVLLCGGGEVKLSDFGLSATNPAQLAAAVAAAAASSSSTATAAAEEEEGGAPVLGSVYWMAPETVRGQRASLSSDIWSLGCFCVELLDGRPPLFDRTPANALYTIAEGTEPVPLPVAPLSEAGQQFIRSCLNRDPARRPTAAELLRSPWFSDARVRLRLDALVARIEAGDAGTGGGGLDEGGSGGSDDDVGQWVESCLFADAQTQRVAWVREGSLAKVVLALPYLTAAEANNTVRSFACVAEQWGAGFADPLGATALWAYGGMAITSEMPRLLATVFAACCESQAPAVWQFGPAHAGAIQFFLSHDRDGIARRCIDAMWGLYCGAGEEGGENSPDTSTSTTATTRRLAALRRLVSDGGLLAVRAYLESACQVAFARGGEAPPGVGWDGVERLFAVVMAASEAVPAAAVLLRTTCHGGSDESDGTVSPATVAAPSSVPATPPPQAEYGGAGGATPTGATEAAALAAALGTTVRPWVRWNLAVQEASRHSGPSAAEALVTLVVDGLVSGAAHGVGCRWWRQQQQHHDRDSDDSSNTGDAAADDPGGPSCYLDAAGVSLAALLTTLAAGTPGSSGAAAAPDATRLRGVRLLAPLAASSPRAAAFFADRCAAVPLLGYLQLRPPGAGAEGAAAVLAAVGGLCGRDRRVAAACAASALFAHGLAAMLCAAARELRLHYADGGSQEYAAFAGCLALAAKLMAAGGGGGGPAATNNISGAGVVLAAVAAALAADPAALEAVRAAVPCDATDEGCRAILQEVNTLTARPHGGGGGDGSRPPSKGPGQAVEGHSGRSAGGELTDDR